MTGRSAPHLLLSLACLGDDCDRDPLLMLIWCLLLPRPPVVLQFEDMKVDAFVDLLATRLSYDSGLLCYFLALKSSLGLFGYSVND